MNAETISDSFISGWSQVYWSEFLFDDLSLKMFESWYSFADCSILPLLEQAFQWVQKNFCGTFPSMRNYNFKEFWPLNLSNSLEFDAWRKGMWGKLDYRWRIRLTLPPFTSLVVERLVYIVIWIHRGRSREMKLQVRFNSKESCISNMEVILFNFRIKSILLQWSLSWWRNFMFGSNQPFADCSIHPLLEQAFQWVQKNFCGAST